MPLVKSGSDKARKANIAREIGAGKDPKQAVAIAYSVQRKAKQQHTAQHGKMTLAEVKAARR